MTDRRVFFGWVAGAGLAAALLGHLFGGEREKGIAVSPVDPEDVFDVTDYGVVGDGSTDDIQAFRAAAEAAGSRPATFPRAATVCPGPCHASVWSEREGG